MTHNVQSIAVSFFLRELKPLPFLSAQMMIGSTARSVPRPPSKKWVAACGKLSAFVFFFI
jgi:hypothetical protein